MTTVLLTGPIAVEKRAVCWLDVLVFAIFITASLALWSAADRYVTEQSLELRPVKEDFEQKRKVPALQAGLTMAQDDLKTMGSKLVELRMEETRLAADLSPPAKRPRVRLLSPQREQRVRLLKTLAMARMYESQLPKKMEQLGAAATAVFQAKHSAGLAYDKALKEFRFTNKTRVLGMVLWAWAFLAVVTCLVCNVLRSFIGHGRTSHVLVPGVLLMASALIYYLVK